MKNLTSNAQSLEFDDVFCTISIKGKEALFSLRERYGSAKFSKALEILLTPSQLDRFIGNDSARTFKVSNKKIAEVQTLIDNNEL